MKKILLVLVVCIGLCTPVFAASPEPASFDVSTVVQGINRMKITTTQFSGNPEQFESAETYTGPLQVTSAGNQDFSAYLTILSNNRKGYSVSMSATAMASAVTGQATAYIDYIVTINGQSITTDGATSLTPVDVITVPSMAGLGSQSDKLSINVDQAKFDAAVEGTYTGTVTFVYTANS
ncbi:hypothetical protein [Sphaerochaeta globosa]|uniref:Uncharacterized protein n=1 Tax=Sphaerochaeta globosa (strain ATCC BAA-1886 / DSM 22777 / Buddy) TaxID=158189 RepID=F0RXP0_SPHGB|nr:hypothetical protein [Sphaerochaeta globosa]ADY12090.1 hypothetical protein SpiBuddy_0251 [Sphaerochaeta globosa str. Buddy]